MDALKRSPDSSLTRKLITASGQYGLTQGSYQAEVLSLTDLGAQATDASVPQLTQAKARIELAVLKIEPFKSIFDKYAGGRLPQIGVMQDTALGSGVDETTWPSVSRLSSPTRDSSV